MRKTDERNLGTWYKRELTVKYRAVPESDPTGLSLDLNGDQF